MKAVILDMYGVIRKETGDGFVPMSSAPFPTEKQRKSWDKT